MSCIPPNSDCGCLNQVTSDCVFYKGDYLSCLDVTQGDDLTDILTNINNLICNIPTPTGISYVGTPNEIDVTGNVISLSNTVTTDISNLKTNVTSLKNCVATTVREITSSSLNVTINNTNPCGRSINIEYTPALPLLSEQSGVIDNYVSTTLTTGYEYSKDFTTYGLKTGDVITIKGTIRRDNTQTSSQFIYIYNGSNFANNNLISSNGGSNNIYQNGNWTLVDFEIKLTVVSNILGNITYKTYGKAQTLVGLSTNAFFELPVSPLINIFQYPTNLALSGSTLTLAFTSTDEPVMEQFIVEITRKL